MRKPKLSECRKGGLTGPLFFDIKKVVERHESAFLQQPFIQNNFLGGVCADSQRNQRAVQQHPQNPGHAGQDLSRSRGQRKAQGVTKVKAWNVRDQTDENLMRELTKTYKAIDAAYSMLRKAATIEDAKYYVELAFRKKAAANDIEVEILRRDIDRGKEE